MFSNHVYYISGIFLVKQWLYWQHYSILIIKCNTECYISDAIFYYNALICVGAAHFNPLLNLNRCQKLNWYLDEYKTDSEIYIDFLNIKKIEILVLRKRFVQSSVIIIADNKLLVHNQIKVSVGNNVDQCFQFKKKKKIKAKREHKLYIVYTGICFFFTQFIIIKIVCLFFQDYLIFKRFFLLLFGRWTSSLCNHDIMILVTL